MGAQPGTSLGLYASVLIAAGVEVAIGLVDGEGDRLAVVVHLQRAVLVDGRVAVGLGFAAEELRRGAADHEGLAAALDVHRLVLRLHVDPVAHELLALHPGAAGHQQRRGQCGPHPLHHRAYLRQLGWRRGCRTVDAGQVKDVEQGGGRSRRVLRRNAL